ncbi:hypothetical protein [Streptomyces sp. NPDC095817]|uniref:hypothetical protein n=1 Tax=Streptomyces sp. NPDC095817 TaxID=3155082 RepID=UPI003333B8D2
MFQRDDRKIRALLAQRKEHEAGAFCMGWEVDTSNAHFGAWMTELDKVTDINRWPFNASVQAGCSSAGALGALALVAALTPVGLRPRLIEFR